ncbi:unnamed protein product [Lactuca virosa]|uniref:Uncharacterized protein n=1 Tax=Lactuca virosa TaxID=75947 RepID=A0AAU9N193_9ASTR|nr:unnamed protein product [Lactuca virosa]
MRKKGRCVFTCLDVFLAGDRTDGQSLRPLTAMEMRWRAVGGGDRCWYRFGKKEKRGFPPLFLHLHKPTHKKPFDFYQFSTKVSVLIKVKIEEH